MARLRGTGLRRPLLIYFAAVVGPTVVVLTLGLLTIRRQADAVRALKASTARSQEQQLHTAIEQLQRVSAAEVFADSNVHRLAARLPVAFGPELDRLRAEIAVLRIRHPIVREMFVAGPEGVRYPRLQPPIFSSDQIPGSESRAFQTVLAEAETSEESARYSSAIRAYERAVGLATGAEARGLAAVRLARALEQAGEVERAVEEWRRIARSQTEAYSRDGRPYRVVAAIELHRLSKRDGALVESIRSDLIDGRWSVTPGQFDYFVKSLGSASDGASLSGFQRSLAFAGRLHAAYPRGHSIPAGQPEVASISVDGALDILALMRGPNPSEVTGVALDTEWIRGAIVQSFARERPAVSDELTLSAPAAGPVGFRAGPPVWSVGVRSNDVGGWPLRDVAVFGAGVVAVIGVLLMGVVLLTRDIAREAELNRLRADLVSGVSHELKAPLSVIRMYAETIRDALPSGAPEKLPFAETIVQETDRLRRLIDDVVDFSKIQQGQRVYRLVAADLNSVIEATADRFAGYAQLHGLRLDAQIPPALPLVRFDGPALEQAIMNLLDNAAKYSGDSTCIDLRVFVQGPELGIEVADHGLGIPADDQGWIFERFRRGEHPDRGGYGLGLYLVRHIVEAHGGRIDVWSAPGVGSRFTIYLPIDSTPVTYA